MQLACSRSRNLGRRDRVAFLLSSNCHHNGKTPKPMHKGVASTIKNVAFDLSSHPMLFDEDAANLLPYLLLPITGPEEYPDEEVLGMFDESDGEGDANTEIDNNAYDGGYQAGHRATIDTMPAHVSDRASDSSRQEAIHRPRNTRSTPIGVVIEIPPITSEEYEGE